MMSRNTRLARLVILAVQILGVLGISGANPCHQGVKFKRAWNCTNIVLPNDMCESCLFRTDSFYGAKEMEALDSHPDIQALRDANQPATCDDYSGLLRQKVTDEGEFAVSELGKFRDCAGMYNLNTGLCLGKMQEFVDLNPCDDKRRAYLETIKRCNADPTDDCGGYAEAITAFDFVLYATCEACCDCIHFTAGKFETEEEEQYNPYRGNCYAHPRYDICSLYPNIQWLGGPELKPANPVPVCSLMKEFNNMAGPFLGKTYEFTLVDDKYEPFEPFLDTLWSAFQCNKDVVYKSCFDLECAQGRLGIKPTNSPTRYPSVSPSAVPTGSPSLSPSFSPSVSPTHNPSSKPTKNPTSNPTLSPSSIPSTSPTLTPTTNPTESPSITATTSPTKSPTTTPTTNPTKSPSKSPTTNPTKSPSTSPTVNPTKSPSTSPTTDPTKSPSKSPTTNPTKSPSKSPTTDPTNNPSNSPTNTPTVNPTNNLTKLPTESPDNGQSSEPTSSPSLSPTISPTPSPTGAGLAPGDNQATPPNNNGFSGGTSDSNGDNGDSEGVTLSTGAIIAIAVAASVLVAGIIAAAVYYSFFSTSTVKLWSQNPNPMSVGEVKADVKV